MSSQAPEGRAQPQDYMTDPSSWEELNLFVSPNALGLVFRLPFASF